MRITEEEFTALIQLAVGGRVVEAKYGIGWVELSAPPGHWTYEAVEAMRIEASKK